MEQNSFQTVMNSNPPSDCCDISNTHGEQETGMTKSGYKDIYEI